MEGRLLLKDCSLFRADGRVRSGLAVVIEGRLITAIGPDADHPVRPGDWAVKCGGRLVMPGLVDCHTRLVGGMLTPWSGDFLLRSFHQRFALEQRVETELTEGEVAAITACSLVRGLKQGVTMYVEHLHAPRCVEAALAAQARVAEALGARLVNSHASSSQIAGSPGVEQVEANARYLEGRVTHELVRGAIGVRASFCADDDVLRAAGRVKETLPVGAHFALAESDDDLAYTWAKYGTRVVSRFERFGLLGGASVAAHARSIDRAEVARLAKSRTLVALTPRTTQALEGGSALGMEAVLVNQSLVGLGTAGTGTLSSELAASFTGVMALARVGRMLDPDSLMANFLIGGPAELNTMIFGVPSGSVDPGSIADLVVVDFVPPNDVGGAAPHLLVQAVNAPVAWTIVNGRVVVREGQLVGADHLELQREGALAVASVWARAGVPAQAGEVPRP
jgi:cytosine/adenosine deaminase-related metal-dependent hydrolase